MLVAAGFALFLALIWLIASGEDFVGGGNNGQAHAASKGLNGYAGLARLLETEGYRGRPLAQPCRPRAKGCWC